MKANIGDIVKFGPYRIEIAEILAQSDYGDDIDLEFKDAQGGYHHWKSWDGGELIKK